jgi:hypothetical protein
LNCINFSIKKFNQNSLVQNLTHIKNANLDNAMIGSHVIYNGNLTKKIFRRLDSTKRLQYVDNSDAIVIANIDA